MKRIKLFQGDVLKSARQAYGISLDALAEKVGCSKSYIWELEQGKSEPGIGVAIMLANALGCSVYHFVGQPMQPDMMAILGAKVRALVLEPTTESPTHD